MGREKFSPSQQDLGQKLIVLALPNSLKTIPSPLCSHSQGGHRRKITFMNPQILYVTGGNSPYFLLIATLLGSFSVFVPNRRLMVCDFGFTEGQARFFDALGILLPKPKSLPTKHHPFYYKACVGHYVRHLDFDVLVWLDADFMIVGPIENFLIQGLGAVDPKNNLLIACPDPAEKTVAEFVATFPGGKTESILEQLANLPGAAKEAYLNGGLYALRGRHLLDEYYEIVNSTKPHYLFDQNAFNYIIYKNGVHVIQRDWLQWNISGPRLNDLVVDTTGDKLIVRYKGKRVWNVHLSDSKEQSALKLVVINSEVEKHYLLGLLREPINLPLREAVYTFLRSFLIDNIKHKNLLLESGALLTEKPDSTKIPILDNPLYKPYVTSGWQG